MGCSLRRTSPPLLLASLGLICLHAVPGFAAPPVVVVSQPVQREVADVAEFTGRLKPSKMIELRARVTGYLDKVNFKEGSDVKQGDVLFEIDPRPYQAQLDQAQAQVVSNEAEYKYRKAVFVADQAAPSGAVSREQMAQDAANVEQADARSKAAVASTEVYKLNMEFTQVKAPITGRISRPDLDPGNLVLADSTRLGVLVSVDPMHVAFDIDERTALRFRQNMQAGKTGEEGKTPLEMGLGQEEGFPQKGQFTFFDSQENAETGTIRAWGELPNPGGLFLPGMSARVRMPLGKPHPALLVPDEAVLSAGGQKFLARGERKESQADPGEGGRLARWAARHPGRVDAE